MTQRVKDWSAYPNFKAAEFDCQASGENDMQTAFMDKLQALRIEYGKPMRITSGYRHPQKHPIERAKEIPGVHAFGRAADIAVSGADALKLVSLAVKHGFTGIGIQQKGASRFIHLDDMPQNSGFPRPTIWSY